MTSPKRSKAQPPPKGLSPEAGRVWKALHAEFELTDAAAVQVLTIGLRAYDTARAAEVLLGEQGLTIIDRYGSPKAHPAVDIARQARAQYLGALRMLGIHRHGGDGDAEAAV